MNYLKKMCIISAVCILAMGLLSCRSNDTGDKGCEIIEWNATGSTTFHVTVRNTTNRSINKNNIMINFIDNHGVKGRLRNFTEYKSEDKKSVMVGPGQTDFLDLVKTYDVSISKLYCEVAE